MADSPAEKTDAPVSVAGAPEATTTETKKTELSEPKTDDKDAPKETEETKDSAPDAKANEEVKPAKEGETEAPNATEPSAAEADQSTAEADTSAIKTPSAKTQNNRRKSGGAGSTRKSLSKKASKIRITHLDAKPGDHFLVKLKGFPEWPAIICEESMLPPALLNSRPVTAARPDGTYAEAYADGGKRVNDRNFPVMYLFTNEFGWVVNTALTELTPEMAENAMNGKIRKDLKAAFELAAEKHPIDYYKQILQQFEDDRIAQEEAAKAAAATPKKSKKSKPKASDVDEDVEMADVSESAKAKTKKRKAEEDAATPQRPDSVKKPKIKLNTSSTPKAANGTSKPQNKEASASKPSKAKSKPGEKKSAGSKDTKLTPQERLARKEKEVLYLRHKLQRGLLTRDQIPQESEMDQMVEYLTILENFGANLEVPIIKATKINKVMKAILKLDSIPREEEFKFKSRAQALLDQWNKLMAGEGSAATNGVNGASEDHAEQKKSEEPKTKSESEKPSEDQTSAKEAPEEPKKAQEVPATEEKEESATGDKANKTAEVTA
ncbi:unnamed protein product [Clonostachys byssicola]|uniref:PWWP domain-containing protein n=1 Tax=Clonostachys byssicola TaxID=160290 RepID=A0A9N9UVY6_9HYPO|nr:unnamed protein product [Clonostachys byssicola]